jgi:quercetin dioxygenase-like cupin family protein
MRRRLLNALVLVMALAGASAYWARIQATPQSGFTPTTLAMGRFGNIDVSNHQLIADPSGRRKHKVWFSLQKTHGLSDLYVQSNVWEPGGTTGWHTHPGHSLIIVTAGTVTVYEGDDPSCKPHVYTQGMGFVDEGGDHVHVIRNEDTVEARTIAVQLIPADAKRRQDADANPACSF